MEDGKPTNPATGESKEEAGGAAPSADRGSTTGEGRASKKGRGKTRTRGLVYSKVDRQDGTPRGIRGCRRGAARVGSSSDPRWGKRSFAAGFYVAQRAGYRAEWRIGSEDPGAEAAQDFFPVFTYYYGGP